ncbi:MAG: rubredoxin [Herminiimonas sp.]|nr:rubredoxin [Herminiimonas sp.]
MSMNEKAMDTAKDGKALGFKTWMCLICGWIYDEAAGVPDEGIAAGTRWEDVPMNWTCPECGARKEDFEMVAL